VRIGSRKRLSDQVKQKKKQQVCTKSGVRGSFTPNELLLKFSWVLQGGNDKGRRVRLNGGRCLPCRGVPGEKVKN